MEERLRQNVRERAGNRCEYCRLRQEHEPFHPFHVEHVIARQHRGTDEFENLALACIICNLNKGPNLTGRDLDTDAVVRLFDPRVERWDDHFEIAGALILGRTPTGRTTAWLFRMNREERVELRQILLDVGQWP